MNPADVDGPLGAFALAVGAAAMTAAAMLTILVWLDSSVPAPPMPLLFLFALVAAAIVIAPAAAAIGLPLTWLLVRAGREAPWAYPTAGLLAGAAVMVGLDRIGAAGAWRPADELLTIASVGALPGCVCGLSWWCLHRRHFHPEAGE